MVGLRKGPHCCNGARLGCQALDALTINCELMPSLDTDGALSSRTWQDKGREEPLGYGTNWQIGGPPLWSVWRRTRYRILQRLPVRRFPSFTPDVFGLALRRSITGIVPFGANRSRIRSSFVHHPFALQFDYYFTVSNSDGWGFY